MNRRTFFKILGAGSIIPASPARFGSGGRPRDILPFKKIYVEEFRNQDSALLETYSINGTGRFKVVQLQEPACFINGREVVEKNFNIYFDPECNYDMYVFEKIFHFPWEYARKSGQNINPQDPGATKKRRVV